MKLNYRQKLSLDSLLKQLSDQENDLKEIINDFLSSGDAKQLAAFQKLYKMCSDSKDVNAIYLLGFCYLYGIGNKSDFAEALILFR